MFKKIAAIVLASLMLCSCLTACGSNNNAPIQPAGDSGPNGKYPLLTFTILDDGYEGSGYEMAGRLFCRRRDTFGWLPVREAARRAPLPGAMHGFARAWGQYLNLAKTVTAARINSLLRLIYLW